MSTFVVVLDDLILDESVWPREGLNEERVQEFTELYASDGMEALPPLVVTDPFGNEQSRSLTDGWHRVEAARRAGLINLLALEQIAETDEDAFLQAVRFSAVSSLPMTRAEKRAAVDRLLREHSNLSDRAIAKDAGVSHPYVAARRRELNGVTGNVTTSKEEDHAPSGKSGPGLTAEQAAEKLLRGMEQVTDSGLFLFNKDGNIAKVLSASARRRYGNDAAKRLAEIERWTARAKQMCENAGPVK